ncbi:MAG: hypothetical protein MJ010_03785 [Paludibacteraceae bacterium]|nr:hypothetical protein [Paludibacteraceae bacterium]
MKKIILLCAILGITFFGYSQDVKVNINNEDATVKDECPYRINGICSTDDIGGVDVIFINGCPDCYVSHPTISLKNYNSFPVTVLWSVVRDGKVKTGVTILGVDANKEIPLGGGFPEEYSLNGLIVRKLAQ